MNDTFPVNGHRRIPIAVSPTDLPSVQHASSQQHLATSVDNTSLQQILATISTPAGKLLKVISKSLGSAEAEIEFVERIKVREE